MKKQICYWLLFFFAVLLRAQAPFPEKCLGVWNGKMYLYSKAIKYDSVSVTLTVARTDTAGVWTWKTVYHSQPGSLIKDYLLRQKNTSPNVFTFDEHDGILINAYACDDIMISMFAMDSLILVSRYELRNNALIFEVSAGKYTGGNDFRDCSPGSFQWACLRKQ